MLPAPLGGVGSGSPFDDLDSVLVGVPDEAEPVSSVPHRVGRAFGLDALVLQLRQSAVQVIDADRDVPVGTAHLVAAAVVVQRELELFLLAGEAEEVVRRLELAVTDDRELASRLHAERLVERAALLGICDPVHRVQVATHSPRSLPRECRVAGRPLAGKLGPMPDTARIAKLLKLV